MSATIFISFASQDRKVALTLCSVLESRGFSCWISARDIQPGENFQVAIVQAIRHAKIMLLVFTGNSNNSQEMTKELALASQQKLMVVPLRIEDVTPNDAFAYEFATRQWIDFFADWEFAIDQLCRRIGYAIGQDGAPPAEIEAAAPIRLSLGPRAEPPAAKSAAPPEAGPAPTPKPPKAAKPPASPPRPAARMTVEQDEDAPKKRGLGLGLVAAIVLVLVGLGVTAPLLFKSKPKAPPLPMAAAAPLTATPEPRAAVALVPAPAPAAEENTTAEAVAEPAPVVRHRASKPNRHAESKLPY